MELKSPYLLRYELPEDVVKEFYSEELTKSFSPSSIADSYVNGKDFPSLFTIDLYKTLAWLYQHDYPKPLEKEVCPVPVLLHVPEFSISHLLFHYDGTPNSADLIRKFIHLFKNIIGCSKATIISPCFIPKSKMREEQELIQLISAKTEETSFIKFDFNRIGDFWSYAVKHDCTLLVTTKNYQADLAKVLFHFYKGKIWSDKLSFYLSV